MYVHPPRIKGPATKNVAGPILFLFVAGPIFLPKICRRSNFAQ